MPASGLEDSEGSGGNEEKIACEMNYDPLTDIERKAFS